MGAHRHRGRSPVETIGKADIRYIQALRHAVGISDDAYDDMKRSVGVGSTKDLTVYQFRKLVARIKGRADGGSGRTGGEGTSWKPVHRSAKKSGMHRQPAPDREEMIRKVEAILTEFKLPWSYADGIAKRMFGIDRLRWCDGGQTYKVLQALTVKQRRARDAVRNGK